MNPWEKFGKYCADLIVVTVTVYVLYSVFIPLPNHDDPHPVPGWMLPGLAINLIGILAVASTSIWCIHRND